MTDDLIHFYRKNNIGWLILCNPPGNIMDEKFFDAFAQIIDQHVIHSSFTGLVVRGVGRHFSSGADITGLASKLRQSTNSESEDWLQKATQSFQVLTRMTSPVIAAITGCCFGSGFELALACHYRIATHNTVIALPESTFGLMPGCGGCIRLPQLTGLSRSIDMILSGRLINATKAKEWGLIDMIVKRQNLSEFAENFLIRLENLQ